MSWEPRKEELVGLNVKQVRDLMIKCFIEAQKETMAKAKQHINVEMEITDAIMLMIKRCFKQCNGDFENPTKEMLIRVIERLKSKAVAFGTPSDIVKKHVGYINIAIENMASA